MSFIVIKAIKKTIERRNVMAKYGFCAVVNASL